MQVDKDPCFVVQEMQFCGFFCSIGVKCNECNNSIMSMVNSHTAGRH